MNKVNTTKRIALVARILAVVMLLSCVVPILSQFDFTLWAAGSQYDAEFTNGGVIVIQSSGTYFIDGTDKEIYSITVTGDIDVTLNIQNVMIDGRDWTYAGYTTETGNTYFERVNTAGAFSSTRCNNYARALYQAGLALNWRYSGNSYYVPTCPLLITNGASVTVNVHGENTFRAGVNRVYVTGANVNNTSIFGASNTGNPRTLQALGYAGVQVDPGASLVLNGTRDSVLNAYGGWQFERTGTITNGNGNVSGVFLNRNDDGLGAYATARLYANGRTYESAISNMSGGAGIGGGPSYNSTTIGGKGTNNQVNGPSGAITINGPQAATINVYGGHQAAGIGGATNSPAAAPGSAITINGCTLKVQGGRWAAGIGDGDSAHNAAGNDYAYADLTVSTYNIVINGGWLDVSGGVAAAGIGTTDKLSSGTGVGANAYSRMNITILGGNVKVRSGFPDSNAVDYEDAQNVLTSAIGAGEDTNMRPNSITIGAAVNLDAASFSKYAINNYGTATYEDTVPVVNIDSASHIFLCNFANYPSAVDRTISLWPVKTETVYLKTTETDIDGNEQIVYMPIDSHESVLYRYEPDKDKPYQSEFLVAYNGSFVFCFEETIDGEDCYVIESLEHMFVRDASGDSIKYVCQECHGELNSHDVHYIEDKSGDAIAEYAVPDYFKAIAITLPTYDEDEANSGHYVVDIPMTGVPANKLPDGYENGDTIMAGITSVQQGVISGEIKVPSEFNVTLNPVSDHLDDINVFAGSWTKDQIIAGSAGTDYVIVPAGQNPLYSYTVYLPNGTTSATLQMMYTNTATATFSVDYIQPDKKTDTATGYAYTVSGLVPGVPVTVRVQVQETVSDSVTQPSAITYAITLVVRDEYTMTITPPTHTYDGKAVSVTKSFFSITDDEHTGVYIDDALFSEFSIWYSATENGAPIAAPTAAGTYWIHADLIPANKSWQAHGKAQFTINKKTIVVTGIQNWTQYLTTQGVNANDPNTYIGPFDAGEIYLSGVVSGDTVTATIPTRTLPSGFVIKDADTAGMPDDAYTLPSAMTLAQGYAFATKTIVEQSNYQGRNFVRLYCVLTGDDAGNYALTYTGTDSISGTSVDYVDVLCRLYFDMKGAIFRGDNGESTFWNKFFPVNSDDPLNFGDPLVSGNFQHAGGSHTHAEHVFFRTENQGNEGKLYAVDLEYGSMDFHFTREVWNVNELRYEDLPESLWIGFDGVNNRLTVSNYSNASVEATVSVTVSQEDAPLTSDSIYGLKAEVSTTHYSDVDGKNNQTIPATVTTTVTQVVDAAVPKNGAVAGYASEKSFYIMLYGIPKNESKAVGSFTVTVAKSTP